MESGEHPLSPKLHLYIKQEICGTFNLLVQVQSTRVGVQLSDAEVVFLISLCDADDDVVSGVRWRGSDAEDLSRNDDVGLKA